MEGAAEAKKTRRLLPFPFPRPYFWARRDVFEHACLKWDETRRRILGRHRKRKVFFVHSLPTGWPRGRTAADIHSLIPESPSQLPVPIPSPIAPPHSYLIYFKVLLWEHFF
jgi:hypothetical protein